MTQEQAIELALMGKNIFLTGRAGTGKTYTLNNIIDRLRSKGKTVAVTASTGIAATHLNGKTIHSWSKLPWERGDIKRKLIIDDLYKIKNNRFAESSIRNTNVLIIDEISMLHDYILDLVDEISQFIKGNKKPFGGIQIIVCGDFFQLPPVNKNQNGDRNYAFNSKSWASAGFSVCYLKHIYRQSDPVFIDILNNIRGNCVNSAQMNVLKGLSENIIDQDKSVNLFCKNINVDIINARALAEINEPGVIYEMEGNGLEFLVASLKKNCLAPEKLQLKIGAHVMFLINNFEQGIVNGTMGEISKFDEHTEYNKKGDKIGHYLNTPFVKIFKTGKEVAAIPHTWKYEDYDVQQKMDVVKAKISQIPLKLAWAITIHKSQGATFDYVDLNLSDVFEYSMGYVALSRATSLEGLYLSGFNDLALQVDNEIIAKDREFQDSSNK